jgi:hypothetical protein
VVAAIAKTIQPVMLFAHLYFFIFDDIKSAKRIFSVAKVKKNTKLAKIYFFVIKLFPFFAEKNIKTIRL